MDRDSWETPKSLFDTLNDQYHFKFDCCATKKNRKVLEYSNDFLNDEFMKNRAWMNPPFSKAYELFKYFFAHCFSGITIYRCDNIETKVWQDIILKHATWILIPKGRICYEGMKGKGSRFPSAIIGYKLNEPKNIQGTLLYPKNKQ